MGILRVSSILLRIRADARGLILGGSSSRLPTYFLCFAKESRQRKATPGRAPVRRLRRRWCPVLLENRGRPELAPAAPSLRTCGADCPPVFCDARRALRGGKAARRGGQGTESIVFLNGRDASRMGHIVVCRLGALPLPRVVPAQAGTQARNHSVATVKTR